VTTDEEVEFDLDDLRWWFATADVEPNILAANFQVDALNLPGVCLNKRYPCGVTPDWRPDGSTLRSNPRLLTGHNRCSDDLRVYATSGR
jgi:hypothetical protein